MLTSRSTSRATSMTEWALSFAERARNIAPPRDASRPEPEQALKLPVGDTVLELRALAEDSERKQTLFAGDADAPPSSEGDPNCAVEMVFQVGRAGDDEDAAAHGWSSANARDGAATLLGSIAQSSALIGSDEGTTGLSRGRGSRRHRGCRQSAVRRAIRHGSRPEGVGGAH